MLFNRVCSLVIGKGGGEGKELAGLRISFSIQKGATRNPNKCTVKVYNVSETTRAMIEVVGNVLILKAGYAEDVGAITIFSGNVTRSLTTREGSDFVTELELQDGFLEIRDTKLTLSFPAGTNGVTVLTTIAQSFNLPIRPLASDVLGLTYKDGFAYVGKSREAMTKACDFLGLEWSIQNREIQIVKKGATYKNQAFVISADTGMVGSPAPEAKTMSEKSAAKEGYVIGKNGTRLYKTRESEKDGKVTKTLQVQGYKVVSLLQPQIDAGAIVQVKNRTIKGEFFRVEELKHVGDTHGSEWHTELTLRVPK